MSKDVTLKAILVGDDKSMSKTFDGAGTAAEGAGKKGAGFGTAMAAGMAVAVTAVAAGAAVIAASFLAAMDVEKANDKMAAQLGLTAAESERIGGVAGSLYTQAYGDSLSGVNDAVVAVMTSVAGASELPDAALEKLTANALNFAEIFEVDVSRAAQVAGQAVKQGLAGDATEAFDLMVAASQKVPVALRDDILDAVDEYGGVFAQLGMSGEEAFGALVTGAEKGMYGIDKTGDALKEFTIRATDMSKLTTGAFDTIGLDAGEMANAILAGGESASGAMDQIVTGLLGIEDPAAQAEAAIALFGTPLEDLGTDQIPAFLTSLQGGSDVLGDFEGAAERAGDTLNDNLATQFEEIKRTAIDAFVTNIGGPIVNALSGFIAEMEAGTGPGGAFRDALEDVRDGAVRLGTWIRDDLWPALKQGYDTIMPGVTKALDIMSGGVDGGGASFKGLGDLITKVIIPVLSNIINVWLPLLATQWRMIITVVGGVWTALSTLMGFFTQVVRTIAGGLAGLMRMWADMLRALSRVPGFGWAADAAGKMDNAADQAQRIADNVRSIPRSWGVTVGVRTVYTSVGTPGANSRSVLGGLTRATGGPVTDGRSYLVGENGPELFTPSGSGSIKDARNTAKVLGGSRSGGASGGGSDQPLVVQLMLDGRMVQEVLVNRKRAMGGAALGLA